MTMENPWLAGGSVEEPGSQGETAAERDQSRSLDSGFAEESPTSATAVVTPTVSTAVVHQSRRAMREALRSAPPKRGMTRAAAAPTTTSAPISTPVHSTATAPTLAPARTLLATRVPLARRVAKKSFPPVVMLAAAALLVGTSVPANALFDPKLPPSAVALSSVPVDALEVVELEDQVIEADAADVLTATAAVRDDWSVTSYAEMLRVRYGSNNYSYSTSGVGAIRWPFAFAAPITSGFGSRLAPCRGCPANHRGLDFAPGVGAAIGSVADGTVSAVGWSNAYGYRVEIEHIINGQRVISLYAHMVDNSSMFQVGSAVVAGDVVGAVGNTGLSTGPHLHLEIRIDGVPIDPFPWLTTNAG